MRAQYAAALKSGDRRIEGRDNPSFGKRDRLAPQAAERPAGLPDTAMAAAFLRALVRLAARRHEFSTKIVIPTGIADGSELARVLRALGLLRTKPGNGRTE